jgi:hypothetical protein
MALHVTALEWKNIMGEGDWLASVLKIWKRMYFALAHSCDKIYDFKYGMMLELTEIIYGGKTWFFDSLPFDFYIVAL